MVCSNCRNPTETLIMECLLTAMIGGLVLFLIYFFASDRCRYWEKRGFPHLEESVLDVLKLFRSLFIRRYGMSAKEGLDSIYARAKGRRYVGYNSFVRPQILLLDPELIYTVLIKDFSYFTDRPFTADVEREPLTDHLFGQQGDGWRALRYKLSPTFTTGKLRKMVSQIDDCVEDILACIGARRGEPLESTELTKSHSLNVVGSVAFGMKVDAHKYLDGVRSEFVDRAHELFSPTPKVFFLLMLSMFSERLTRLLGLKFISDETTEFFTKLIKEAIEQRKGAGSKRNDFLQLMINLKEKDEGEGEADKGGKEVKEEVEDPGDEKDNKELLENWRRLKSSSQNYKFTDKRIAANSFGFLSGGSETSAMTISFAFYEMARNPHVQAKLQAEIDEKLSNEKKVDYNAINSLTYLEQVVFETLRKHSPIITVNRMSSEDYRIPGTNDVIKKGEEVVIPVSSLHNDPDHFPDPETFDPDRFLDPNAIAKGTYLPFGLGPRFCIAKRLALLNVKMFIARTLMLYNVRLSSKTKLPLEYTKNTFMSYVEGGIWIEFVPRK